MIEMPKPEKCIVILETLYRTLRQITHPLDIGRPAGVRLRSVPLPTSITGQRGRPRYDISYEQLCHCLRLGFNWQGIASLLGIDRCTLFQHRQRLIIRPLEFAELSNYELNTLVRQILQRTQMQARPTFWAVSGLAPSASSVGG